MQYTKKANLHVHTLYSDGIHSVRSVLKSAKKQGLDVIAITDHNEIRGAKKACRLADQYGLTVIPGAELFFRVEGKLCEVLAYFSKIEDLEKFYYDFRFERFVPKFEKLEDLITQIKSYGGAPAAPHPYGHKGLLINKIKINFPAIEVLNCFHDKHNNGASKVYADKNHSIELASADMHVFRSALSRAYTIMSSNYEITRESIIKNLNGEQKTIRFVPKGTIAPSWQIWLQDINCSFMVVKFLIRQDFTYLHLHNMHALKHRLKRLASLED